MGDLSKAIPIAARPKAASSAGPGDHLKTTPAQTTAMTAAVESINEGFGGVVATPFPMETPPPPPRRNRGSANAKPKGEVSDTAATGSLMVKVWKFHFSPEMTMPLLTSSPKAAQGHVRAAPLPERTPTSAHGAGCDALLPKDGHGRPHGEGDAAPLAVS